jgi:hypothetical protein
MSIWFPGCLLALANARRTEFAQFVTDAGVPAVAIPRSVRGSADFEAFVGRVLDQIRRCKRQEKETA